MFFISKRASNKNARVRKTNTIATTVKKDVQSVAPRRWWRRHGQAGPRRDGDDVVRAAVAARRHLEPSDAQVRADDRGERDRDAGLIDANVGQVDLYAFQQLVDAVQCRRAGK